MTDFSVLVLSGHQMIFTCVMLYLLKKKSPGETHNINCSRNAKIFKGFHSVSSVSLQVVDEMIIEDLAGVNSSQPTSLISHILSCKSN